MMNYRRHFGKWYVSGSDSAHLNAPSDVCNDGTHLYIVDTANSRVVKVLISNLSFVAEFGTNGSGDNQFSSVFDGICTDGTYLYITDRGNYRVKKHLCSDLSYVSKIGSYGTGNDQFTMTWNGPITTDGTHIYVGDTTRIVKRLCSDLSYVSEIGTNGSGNDQFGFGAAETGIHGITNDGTYLYVCDTGNDRIHKRLCSDLSYVQIFGTTGSGNNQFDHPWGITTDGTYLWITDDFNGRLKKHLCSDLSFYTKAGLYSGSPGAGNFKYPAGLTLLGDAIYIADPGIQVIIKRWKDAAGTLPNPETGFLYVLNNWLDTLEKRDLSTLDVVASIGGTGSGNNQFITTFYGPTCIATDGTHIYVADGGNGRIKKHLCSDLSYVSQAGGFNSPSGICYYNGKIYFLDWMDYKLYCLNADTLATLGVYNAPTQPAGARIPGSMQEPDGLATDGSNLFSCDYTDFWSPAPNDWQSPLMKFTIADTPTWVSERLNHRTTEWDGGSNTDEDQVCAIAVDDTYIYQSDQGISSAGPRLTRRLKSDYSFVDAAIAPLDWEMMVSWYSPFGIALGDQYIYMAVRDSDSIARFDKTTLAYVDGFWIDYGDLALLPGPMSLAIVTSLPPPVISNKNTSAQVIW